jgi:hypothetical protein
MTAGSRMLILATVSLAEANLLIGRFYPRKLVTVLRVYPLFIPPRQFRQIQRVIEVSFK